MDNEREHILFALSRALQEFTSASTSSRLIPEVGTNIGYAISNAASIEDVAAVPGRIRRAFGRAIYCLPPAFGASDHIARVILTAMKYDPKVRSAMNVKIVDPATIGAYVFDRSLEPTRSASKEGRTMNFMVESAYRSTGSVPRFIVDLGAFGKEPGTFILGEDPESVVKDAIKLTEMV